MYYADGVSVLSRRQLAEGKPILGQQLLAYDDVWRYEAEDEVLTLGPTDGRKFRNCGQIESGHRQDR